MNLEENKKIENCNNIDINLIKNEYRLTNTESNISFNSVSVSVLPKDVEWYEMEGFVDRKYGPFDYIFKSIKNEVVGRVKFNFSYSCKGKYNSKGFFLANATVYPKLLFASSGYYLECNVSASNPRNYGTEDEPIPGVDLKLQVRIKSYEKLKVLENSFYIEMNDAEIGQTLNNHPVSVNLSTYDNIVGCKELDTNRTFTKFSESNMINNCKSINTLELYISANIRGDCSASIISAEGY